jgi:acetyl-CoA decarbonylase/synthase complex subunit beta
MADSTAGGRQIPGFHGVSIEYMRSPKFLQVDGGWNRVVWYPQAIKDRVYDFMPEDMRDKIATEEDVSSIDDLKGYLKNKAHPVVERWVELEEAAPKAVAEVGEDYVAVPGQFAATFPAAGGGIQIIFKNAKIYAEKVIIRRIGKEGKK